MSRSFKSAYEPAFGDRLVHVREASGPLPFQEFSPLRELFQQQPKLEHALVGRPALIRDPVFLKSNPTLHDVLRAHPALARVFLPLASTKSQ